VPIPWRILLQPELRSPPADSHGRHREIDVPNGDVLINAGDFIFFSRSLRENEDFNEWLGELPHRCILVPGNHEFFLTANPSRGSLLSNATVLINEEIEIEGLRMWGSPVTPLHGAAFGVTSAEDRRRLYAKIPEDIDVLVTHGRRMEFSMLRRSPDFMPGAESFSIQ
jgi:predicted phosphohydrolase